jgi:cation/acetate symporter
MSSAIYERMRSNPRFQQLVRTRGRFAWTLAITVLAIFYGFVMLVAFRPALLGQPVTEGAALTRGVAGGLFIFVFFWLLTAMYVRRANTEFDALTRQIVDEAVAEEARAAVAAKEIA